MRQTTRISLSKITVVACCLFSLISGASLAEKPGFAEPTPNVSEIDNSTYIDAATILMFVTNHGSFGRDLAGVFGNDFGTYYPYVDPSYIYSEVLDNSVIYAAGCWLGGIDDETGQTLIAVSEYDSEFIPGPMVGGTFLPDNSHFRVYKLVAGAARNSQDYIDYCDYAIPELNAPTDFKGAPLMLGDQTLWTVFNDADPDQHQNDAGETEPLGVEVQMSVWASDDKGNSPTATSANIVYDTEFEVTQLGSTLFGAVAYAADPTAITGNDYRIVVEGINTFEGVDTVWHLDNITTNVRLVSSQRINELCDIVEGLVAGVFVPDVYDVFSSFEVTANAHGPIDPPAAGAFAFAGFPTPNDENPDENQQVGDGLWGIHTSDPGGSCGWGTGGDYGTFLNTVTRAGANIEQIGDYDYEMRFTGSYGNPGVGGGYAVEWYYDNNAVWVPFELWRTGINTPDDPSDDVRLVPYIFDAGDDNVYGLESWGCIYDATHGAYGDHSVSDLDDDPYTDRVYWYMPSDSTPGSAGYLENEADMLAGTFSGNKIAYEIIRGTVLVSWDGGLAPPFSQDCPEEGTVFRLSTYFEDVPLPQETFTFTSSVPPSVVTGPDAQTIHIAYKLYNEGGRTLRDCYFSLWSDPDVGTPGDDVVGCDTLDNVCFAYNGSSYDSRYGHNVPAAGFKILYGPMVPSPGDSAYFERNWIKDCRNLGMTAFTKYINGIDPDNFNQTYWFMRGLTKTGAPYVYNGDELTYMMSGDPVTGVGDVDFAPDDRRMMASCGPFDLNPGDSQYVLIRFAVAQGTDHINSITKLRQLLNRPFELNLPGPKDKLTTVPEKFAVAQNYPNPFNPTTTIQYAIPEQAHVTVDVYNVLGQRVRRLVNKTQAAGVYNVEWNSTDQSGNDVASGIYFYRVRAGEYSERKKMVLVR